MRVPFGLGLVLAQERLGVRVDDQDVGVQHLLVLAQQSHRPTVSLDEGGMGGAARKCLETECTGAGKEVQHARSGNVRREPVE